LVERKITQFNFYLVSRERRYIPPKNFPFQFIFGIIFFFKFFFLFLTRLELMEMRKRGGGLNKGEEAQIAREKRKKKSWLRKKGGNLFNLFIKAAKT